jgi:hypothetical protein
MNKRASNITPELGQRIVQIIDAFSEEISWGLVIAKIDKEIGQRYTEQGLRKHELIAQSYRVKKVLLAKQKELGGNKKYRVATAKRLLELEAENVLLKEQNNRLIEKFVLWAHNATGNNVTEDQLNESLTVQSVHN